MLEDSYTDNSGYDGCPGGGGGGGGGPTCNGTPYVEASKDCCYNPTTGDDVISSGSTCNCGDDEVDGTTYACCDGDSYEIASEGCCNSLNIYDRATHTCCSNAVSENYEEGYGGDCCGDDPYWGYDEDD